MNNIVKQIKFQEYIVQSLIYYFFSMAFLPIFCSHIFNLTQTKNSLEIREYQLKNCLHKSGKSIWYFCNLWFNWEVLPHCECFLLWERYFYQCKEDSWVSMWEVDEVLNYYILITWTYPGSQLFRHMELAKAFFSPISKIYEWLTISVETISQNFPLLDIYRVRQLPNRELTPRLIPLLCVIHKISM